MNLTELFARVKQWLDNTFGLSVSNDPKERCYRYAEESCELLQAAGLEKEELLRIIDYVYSRPVGEVEQEIGGTIITLASLCSVFNVDTQAAFDREFARVQDPEIQARILAKHNKKPEFMAIHTNQS